MACDLGDPAIYSVNVSPDAMNDLDVIYSFIKEVAKFDHFARKQVSTIETSILRLSIFPNGCPKYDDSRPYRTMHIGKYVVFFVTDDEHKTVTILRIFHARQNYDQELE